VEPEAIVLSQADKEARLTERELREYRIFMRLNQPPMAPSTQEKFFQLFLSGINCEEIVRINPGGFSLGAIVRARIENNWDEKRLEHQRNLVATMRGNVQQTILETVEQLTLEMKVYNKLKRDKLLRYLQTGDEKELEGLSIGSTKTLKDVAEALLKLTGQDGEKKTMIGGTVEHRHVVQQGAENAAVSALPVLPAGKQPSTDTAAQALEVIHRSRGGR
jgi:hypothetical protein